MALVLSLIATADAWARQAAPGSSAPASVLETAPQVPSETASPSEALPRHAEDPLAASLADDPVLRFGEAQAPLSLLQRVVGDTLARSPAAAEALASRDEASAALGEAKAGRAPTLDVTITSYRVLDRNFANDPLNVIERSRPDRRTDILLSGQQLLLDGGTVGNRIGAAADRLRGSEDAIDDAADRTALDTLAAWYDVFTYRSLVALSAAFVDSQRQLRAQVEERVRSGASAEGDLARVDSYIASAGTRLARFRRQAAQAEARFEALTGEPAPAVLARPPYAGPAAISRDLAVHRSGDTPAVRAAGEQASAAHRDAKATRAEMSPVLSAGLDAGKYGIYETPRDYDIRANLTIRERLGGGAKQRYEQSTARARAADARATRARVEAARDAEIAWSDVAALQDQLTALRETYVASRRSRDVVAERFRIASGTLIDVLGVEDSYFDTAAGYIQAVTELDAARYVLLSRTGTLLAALGVGPVRPLSAGTRQQ